MTIGTDSHYEVKRFRRCPKCGKAFPATEAMRKSFYWVQQEYNDGFQERLKDIIEDTYRGKLPRVELATKLREEFQDLFNHDTKYFEGVADHIISQSQNMARVNQASKYDVKYYEIVAVI